MNIQMLMPSKNICFQEFKYWKAAALEATLLSNASNQHSAVFTCYTILLLLHMQGVNPEILNCGFCNYIQRGQLHGGRSDNNKTALGICTASLSAQSGVLSNTVFHLVRFLLFNTFK